jgi:hypothetical protein
MLDLIKREPAKFAGFVQALVSVLLLLATDYGLSTELAASLGAAIALGLGWFVAAVSVPTVKMTTAAIDRAATMTPGDIAKVAAVKAEAAKP